MTCRHCGVRLSLGSNSLWYGTSKPAVLAFVCSKNPDPHEIIHEPADEENP